MTLVTSSRHDAGERALDDAIQRAQQHLLSLQHGDGYWWAELECNISMAAEQIMLHRFLQDGFPAERLAKFAAHIRRRQCPDGGWPIFYGGASDVSLSAEAYFALKLCGDSPDAPHMAAARAFVRSRGGIGAARVFTKLWLSLFEQFDWDALPAMPPEIMFLPLWFPINIYNFSSWARATIVPILILFDQKPVVRLPAELAVPELYLDPADRSRPVGKPGRPVSWQTAFRVLDRILRLAGRWRSRPTRAMGLRAAEQWIIAHHDADGSWGGIQPPWVYSLMALRVLGHPIERGVIDKGLRGWESFTIEDGAEMTVQPCISPVWDTCLAMIALLDSGLPAAHPAIRQAADWLLPRQIRVDGDWKLKRPRIPAGGWAFEFANDKYPDTDDTAEVLMALKKAGIDETPAGRDAFQRAVGWLIGMQSRNGGWGGFDVDNDSALIPQIPFCDFGAVIDPPTEDVTAHVVECLAMLGHGRTSPVMARGLAFLRKTQAASGAWWGRWGVNWIYGTGAAVPALVQAGIAPRTPAIRRAVRWLEAHQNPDGGWGEAIESYDDPSRIGRGASTASQTAWALLALIAAGDAAGESARRGVGFLIQTQTAEGGWDEPWFTGTGFPADCMLKYHYYRLYFPLTALGRYRTALAADESRRVGTTPAQP